MTLMQTASKILAFVKRDLWDACSYPIAFGLEIVTSLGSVVSFYFLSAVVGDGAQKWVAPYGADYFSFALVGLAFSNYMAVAVASSGQSLRYWQLIGVIEMNLMSRASLAEIVLYSSIYRFLWTSLVTGTCLAVGWLFFHVSFSHANLLSTLVVFLLMITALYCVGFISTAFTLISKKADPVTWLVGVLSTALGGIVYPIEALPIRLRVISQNLPITAGLNGLRRALLQGASITDLGPSIAVLIVWCVILLPIAVYALRLSLRFAKQFGVLAHY